MTKPLNIFHKSKEYLFALAKRAINNASIYDMLVIVDNNVLVYPNDNPNKVMLAIEVNNLQYQINQLKA